MFDFDGTLYDSPRPRVDRPGWWHSPRSLEGSGPPGYDQKWILPVLVRGRRAIQDRTVRTALLTARPGSAPMQQAVLRMLRQAGLPFDYAAFKPLWPAQDTPTYKAWKILEWLRAEPSITHVVFYDDLKANLDAVDAALGPWNYTYVKVLAPGVT